MLRWSPGDSQGGFDLAYLSKLVGREEELRTLMDGLESANNSQGKVIFIEGEAGIGKTRLVMEMSENIGDKEVIILKGNCLYREETDPYLPFVGALEDFLGDKEGSGAELLEDLSLEEDTLKNLPLGLIPFGESEEKLPPESKESFWETDPQKGQYVVFETMSQFIIKISKKNPMLLFIDDLQWADSASLHLLHYLARVIKDERVMICGAYRQEDLEMREGEVIPLLETLRRMGRENLFETISLKRLSKNDIREMLSSLIGVSKVPEDFVELIQDETKGNPFFIEGVVKSLLDEGIIKPEEGTWKTTIEISRISVPNTIKDIILRRIDRLNKDEREVVKYASIIGENFTLKLLRNVMDIPEDKLIKILDDLIRAKLIFEDFKGREERYTFSHPKIYEVVIEEMSLSQTQLLHRKVGNVLEEMFLEDIRPILYDLAYHFNQGNEPEKTVYYGIEAGERALRSYATDKAFDFYNMALESLRKLDSRIAKTLHYQEKEMEILSRLGEISGTIGEWDDGLDYYQQLIKMGEERDDKKRLTEAFINIGLIQLRRGDWDNAVRNLNKADEISDRIGDAKSMSKVHYHLGVVYERKGEYSNALKNYGKTMSKSVDIGESRIIGKAYTGMGRVYAQQGKYNESIEALEEAVSIFEREGELEELANTYQNLGATYYFIDLNKSIESHNKAIELAEKTGYIRIKAYSLSNVAEVLIKKNQLEKAAGYLSNAIDIFEKIDEKIGMSFSLTHMAYLHRIQKDWEKSEEYVQKSIDICTFYDIPYHLGDAIYEHALLHKDKGERKKAEEKLKGSLNIFKRLDNEEMVLKIKEELAALLPPAKK
ncbi:MAG: tetratricopeptide repeat protein [Thermoplasmata archaeon]|nr:MAG: tetratricopeptide repeat protein [Thermoplasmata archaeon]